MVKTDVVNIASYLPAMAEELPDKMAVAVMTGPRRPGNKKNCVQYTFSELDRESHYIAAGLESIGIGRGVRTTLMVKPSLEFFALTFALFKVGAVPVLIDPGMGVKNLSQCLEEAEPYGFIGISKAHIARIVLGWAKKSVKVKVTVGRRLFWGGFTLQQVRDIGAERKDEFQMANTQADETAAILFTSGSTGVPKGAVYSHGNFMAQVEILKRIYGIEPGEIDLATFPLFALFGPALGMAVVTPVMDATRPASVRPQNIIEPVQDFEITNMFGSPALINRVGRYGMDHNVELPSLKRVISAGAPVPGPVLQRFTQMLGDGVEIFTPYGATESLPVASMGSNAILHETQALTDKGKGVCVGKPIDEITCHIIKISDDPIEEWSDDLLVDDGEVGEVVVRGPQVTKGYYNRPESDKLSKIKTDEEYGFYHRMGDLGYFDEKGRIWFCGRKSHRVILDGATKFTISCEGVFNCHPAVFRTALVGVEKDGKKIPVLCVELEKIGVNKSRGEIEKELFEWGGKHDHTKDITTILFHPSFPVDIRHNSKIFREKLTVWAQGRV